MFDKRLAWNFLSTIQLTITFRDRLHGLLLSEMGRLLLNPEYERAGTKRVANLLHSPRWLAQMIEVFCGSVPTSLSTKWSKADKPVYAIWDEGVWEKPESQKMEDLGPVRSSKAHRLTHYKSPGCAIFVSGMNWLGLLLVGAKARSEPPVIAAMRWWSSRGPHADKKRKLEAVLMLECVAHGEAS